MLRSAFLFFCAAGLALADTSLTLHLPPTQILTQPQTLPPSTHARLTSSNTSLTAPFRRNSRFVFPSIPAGSYLCDVWAHEHVFVPMRVDVSKNGGIEVWQTYRGNEWSNTGEKLGAAPGRADGSGDVELEVVIGTLSVRDFYEKRGGFNPMSLLSNPMILIGVVAMAMMFGMPKLLENSECYAFSSLLAKTNSITVDPEMREEFEKSQASNPLTAALSGGGGTAGGFDMAGWMAGTNDKPSNTGKASGAEVGSAKKRR